MFEYRAVLVRLRLGDSDRDVAKARLMGRAKVAALRCSAITHAWLDPPSPTPGEELDAVLARKLPQPSHTHRNYYPLQATPFDKTLA